METVLLKSKDNTLTFMTDLFRVCSPTSHILVSVLITCEPGQHLEICSSGNSNAGSRDSSNKVFIVLMLIDLFLEHIETLSDWYLYLFTD